MAKRPIKKRRVTKSRPFAQMDGPKTYKEISADKLLGEYVEPKRRGKSVYRKGEYETSVRCVCDKHPATCKAHQ